MPLAGQAAVLLCLLFPLRPAAQEAPLWQLLEGEEADLLVLDAQRLMAMQPGQVFELLLPGGGTWTARVDEVSRFPNGDHSLRAALGSASLEDTSQHSLVLTFGSVSAYGSLSSPQGVYQFQGSGAAGEFAGPLIRYEPVRAQSLDEDFVSPQPAESPGQSEGDFSVVQTAVSRLPAGGDLSITLDIANRSGVPQRDVYADVFFLLENTTLRPQASPSACVQTRSSDAMPVLSCRLGDLAAGGSRRLSYTVATSADSHPLVYSTVLVGPAGLDENSRHDLIVNVFRDVLADGDGDGVSDYNEGLLGSDPFDGESRAGSAVTVIDVLPVHAQGVEEFYAGEAQTRFNQLIAMANTIYEESGVAIRLRQAGVLHTAYEPASLEEDLRALTYASDEAFAAVERTRAVHGADLVVLLRTMGEAEGLCGLANLGAKGLEGDFSAPYQKQFAYSVINLDCLDDSVLAHELGHNMGLVHSRLEDTAGGTFSHAAGYGREAQGNFPGFVTVMAYSGDYGTDNKVFRFSNPRMYCGPSTAFVCGRDPVEDPELGADAVAALNFVRHQIAAYYPSLEERLVDLRAVSKPDGLSGARMLAGATADEGFSYRQSFGADEAVDARILLEPEAGHVGETATLHAVFRLGARGFFQFDQGGRLVPWEDMDLRRLEPLGPPVSLAESLRFDPLRDFRGSEHALAGERVAVFAAYRLVESGRLVFSSQPLSFRFEAEPAAEADGEAAAAP